MGVKKYFQAEATTCAKIQSQECVWYIERILSDTLQLESRGLCVWDWEGTWEDRGLQSECAQYDALECKKNCNFYVQFRF